MGDAGEGLVDAAARLQERLDEMHARPSGRVVADPDAVRKLEVLELGETSLRTQLEQTTLAPRRKQLELALKDITQQIKEARAQVERSEQAAKKPAAKAAKGSAAAKAKKK
jgi:hypothetical protein